MKAYLPEGHRIHTAENQSYLASIDSLAQAMEDRVVLEAWAERCDREKNLHVRLGDFYGIIPREETALGLTEGSIREIAVLARVGRPVCFRVVGLQANDGVLTPILSRRGAQLAARAHLRSLALGTVVDATVSHMERFGAFVDVGCGLNSMIPIDRISISRIDHPCRRFRLGQEIKAVYAGYDEERSHVLLSHKELLGTWEENAGQFSPGETVTGVVRGIQPYGIFIELAPNLTGLAEYTEGLVENQRVSVFIKSIQPQRKKLKLLVIEGLEPETAPCPLDYPQVDWVTLT